MIYVGDNDKFDILFTFIYDQEKQSSQQTELEKRLSDKESELEEAIYSSKEAISAANEKEKLSQDKLLDLNKQLDHALSAKLELEAKVESTSDELR